MDNLDFLSNISTDTIDELYNQYLKDNKSVDQQWQLFFKGFDFARTNYDTSNDASNSISSKEFNVINLIHAYRQRGHLFTHTNPVRERRKYKPTLDLDQFNLTEKDLSLEFKAGKELGLTNSTLKNIVEHLNHTYCQSIGVEYLYIRKPEEIQWLRNIMEGCQNTPKFNVEEKLDIYHHLVSAVGFEKFIHTKFTGQKRFSLEGAETLIPSLDAIIEHGAELGIEEFILGMPHRGRLNIITNILHKPYELVFREFTGKSYVDSISLGDVKYHLGYGNTVKTRTGKKVRLNLAPNPSHLEAVGPVIQGIACGKIKHKYGNDSDKLAPIIIHGDAAMAGQGVVYEVIQMSELHGYQTGGTIHLVINNQVGFTTNYLEARTSTYCTDVAKVTRSPVFHVNGDDAEALVYTIKLALEYRQKFHKDVFIDILCYRKYGHNEGDEPRYTQPVLYKAIARHLNPRDIYAKKLIEEKVATREQLSIIENDFNDLLEKKLEIAQRDSKVAIKRFLSEDWNDYRYAKKEDFQKSIDTKISLEKLRYLANSIFNVPEEENFFNKIYKLLADRKTLIDEDRLDWATGELLTYASLVDEGFPVRLSGQDSQRGTFSHRHAALTREENYVKYVPIKHINTEQAEFNVHNSPLNEYGVLGFEYGYSLSTPKGLTIWEAQFGDFHNAAQIIIDQYISSGEEKWGLANGLVLMLPHGYEGQGPEHSSARMERFITLCAKNNMQLLNITTPANLFHALRMQVKREFRTPMVIFTPKSLLRHPMAVSTKKDFTTGTYQRVIDDQDNNPEKVTRLVLCNGKIYYDLLRKKNELKVNDIAIVRLEQIYPLPKKEIDDLVKKYKNALKIIWVQEEPMNMGAWYFIKNELSELPIEGIYRFPSGSPAVGLHELHQQEQNEIIGKIFKKCTCALKNPYCGLQCKTGKEKLPILQQHKYFKIEK
ncbi:MAG: 2-oxoglutarate dehydrogenase E1 component [Salinivirgaceae bacterium]|jgi:2-oxoglutarate dehydrogenase E1 component|nr:2-oxoglutarate dehydrogenase E1 component [Salinivirgaceae bacterium]